MSSLALTLTRILALANKEVRHVLRDVRTLYIALAMPVVMLLLFGFGVSFDLEHMPLVTVDLDQTTASRALKRRLLADDQFDDAGNLPSAAEAERALVSGKALAALVIERGFSRDLTRGELAQVQLLFDGSDNSSAVEARNMLEVALRTLALSAPDRPRAM